MNLKAYIAEQKERVDRWLLDAIRRLCPSDHLQQPMQYAVTAGGKRLRPILCLAASAAIADDGDAPLPAACALEMIHTYSLIHDDLPALDDDALRRGKATSHVRFGEATAILTGDAFLNMAYEVLSDAGRQADAGDAAKWIEVIQIVSHAAGCQGMLEGQARDLAFEGTPIGADRLQALHRLKTGALIEAAVHSGAVISNGNKNQVDLLKQFARNVGLAFQVTDDILNVTGDPAVMGKAVGSDAERGKNTYPTLMGLEESRQFAAALIADALQALDIFDNKADPLRAIAAYVIDRNR